MNTVCLQPGEWFFSERPVLIDTILGSCLGIVMRHRDGATCVAHCVLPRWNGEPGGEARFVDRCLEQMMMLFDRRGRERSELDVKLFGGSRMLVTDPPGRDPVGRQNLDMALAILRREGIRVSAQDVGGNRGRRILVHSATGEVRVSYV